MAPHRMRGLVGMAGRRNSRRGLGRFSGLKTSIFLEVEGAAHYLPAYAGNLDIMTSAALRTAEQLAARTRTEVPA